MGIEKGRNAAFKKKEEREIRNFKKRKRKGEKDGVKNIPVCISIVYGVNRVRTCGLKQNILVVCVVGGVVFFAPSCGAAIRLKFQYFSKEKSTSAVQIVISSKQPTDPFINQSTNKTYQTIEITYQAIEESTDQSTNQLKIQSRNQSPNRFIYQAINQSKSDCTINPQTGHSNDQSSLLKK